MTGVLFGLVPALRGKSGDSADGLRDGGKTSAAGTSRVARRALVVTEVALAVIMLTGAGLLVRSLVKLQAMELGFKPSNVLTMQLTIPPKRYNDTTADEFFRQVLERVGHLPGVQSAALDGALPITGGESGWSIMLDGRVVKTISEAPYAEARAGDTGLFPDVWNSCSQGTSVRRRRPTGRAARCGHQLRDGEKAVARSRSGRAHAEDVQPHLAMGDDRRRRR